MIWRSSELSQAYDTEKYFNFHCFFLFRYFAMFFLNGDIFPQLKANIKMLRSSPKNIVKSWAQNTPHILGFVNALIRRQVYNKSKLLDVWKKDTFCKCRLELGENIQSMITIFVFYFRSFARV